jgi:fido (protein-threonine AMPylation protein)
MEASGRKRQRKDSDDTRDGPIRGKKAHHVKFELTTGVISQMLRGDPFPESSPPVVKVFPLDGPPLAVTLREDGGSPQQQQHCMLTDENEKVVATILSDSDQSFEKGKVYVVKIKGYVVSQANVKTCEPLLFLIAWDVVRVEKQQRPASSISNTRPFQILRENIQAGKAAHFLQHWAMLLSNADLAGNSSSWQWQRQPRADFVRESHGCEVTDFLAHHAAVQTLHQSPTLHGANETTVTQNYFSVLASFQTSQRDRQSASLTNNAGHEVAARSALVLTQYQKALQVALQDVDATPAHTKLTPTLLASWHGHVCGQGVHPDAGQLRQKNVRVGTSSFCPHQQVAADLAKVCSGLATLDLRLLRQKQPVGITTGVAVAVYAAAALFGVLDTHPFCDGNGRTARIVTNWALRKAGLPFLIQLFATPAQRTEYRQAILQTRRNVSLVSRSVADGVVAEEALMSAMQSAGALAPLVDLILDRMAKAISEFQKLVVEKSSLTSEEAQARAARMYRERAAQGTCIICFDENPNIATLCCGKAVHLNCIAEWLSANSSCPQCRGDLPSLPPRMRPRQPVGPGGGDDDDDDDDDHNTMRRLLQDNVNQLRHLMVYRGMEDMEDGDGTFSSDDDDDDDDDDLSTDSIMEEIAIALRGAPHSDDEEEDDDDDEDDTTVQDLDVSALVGPFDPRYDTEEEDDVQDDDEDDDDDSSVPALLIAALAGAPDNDTDDDDDDDDDDTTEIVFDSEEEDDVDDDDEGEDDTSIIYTARRVTFEDTAAASEQEDDGTMTDDDGANNGSVEEDDDDTYVDPTVLARGDRPHQPPFCGHCRNRSANDCSNACCGKCCVLQGRMHCDRHNC